MSKERDVLKARHKEIKKMSANKLNEFLHVFAGSYADTILVEAMKVLHDEFGFGPKRQAKFITLLNERLKEE